MDVLGEFWIHTVQVETYLGDGANGPVYAAAVEVSGLVEDKRRMVRDRTGREVVSEATFFGPVTLVAAFLPGSRVTVNGRTALVIAAGRFDSGDLGLPDHIQIALT